MFNVAANKRIDTGIELSTQLYMKSVTSQLNNIPWHGYTVDP